MYIDAGIVLSEIDRLVNDLKEKMQKEDMHDISLCNGKLEMLDSIRKIILIYEVEAKKSNLEKFLLKYKSERIRELRDSIGYERAENHGYRISGWQMDYLIFALDYMLFSLEKGV